jgi:hypothetical protein
MLVALLFLGITAAHSNAQELYVTGGTAVNSRGPGWYPSRSTPSAPAVSKVASVTGGIGLWLPHGLAIEGSLAITRAQSIAWHYNYQFGGNADELTNDRDVPLLALIRVAPLRRKSISIEPVAGGGVSLHRGATFVTADCGSGARPTPCVTVTPPRRDEVQTTADWTVTLGADVAIRVSSRLSVAPGFRVNYIRRERFMTGFNHRGPYSGGSHLRGIGVTARYSIHAAPASSATRLPNTPPS